MVMETYYRKRSKKAHQPPSMEMDQCHQKEAAQGSVAAAEPGQSPPPGRCATLLGRESHFLISEGDLGDKAQMQNHIREGDLYEIDHSHLPPRTPAQLRSIRVAMVCEKTEVNIAVRFPSMESLRAFFNYTLRESSHPALDEMFVMGSALAAKVLIRLVPAETFSEQKGLLPFWLISSLADGSCKANGVRAAHERGSSGLSEALKGNGMVTWGIRRQVKYLGRHKESDGSDHVYIAQNSSSSFVNGVEESQIGLVAIRDEGESSEEDEKNGDGDDQENAEDEEEEEDDQEDEAEEEEEEEEEEEVEEEKIKSETNDNSKRKRYSFRNLSVQKTKKAKLEIRKQKQKQTQKKNQIKKNKGRMRLRESLIQRNPKDRWSAERYKLAEQNLLEVMKSKGARTETPILRPQLRAEARKRIGDTGLLDHLLKHMAGKLAPGGQERFRRRHNPDGAMEYWLESADLVNLRKDAGVTDPYWVPPPGWKPGDSPTQDPTCATELKLLKDDISNIKRNLELMASKLQLEGEVRKLRREINEISFKKKQEENQTITVDSNGGDISQKLDLLAASLESSKRDFGYVHVSVEKYKEQLMTISDFVREIEGKFEKLAPNVMETTRTGSSLMVATDAQTMRERIGAKRESKRTQPQVQDALIAAAEGETLQLAKKQKNGQTAREAEEKAAKIQRLKSGFRICKPQGTFLWPNMVKDTNNNCNSCSINNSSSFVQVQVEVPTPPSVSSSTVPPQLPYGGGHYHQYQPPPPASIVKPLAAKRAVTVTVSTVSKDQSYEDIGDAINNSCATNTPTLVNLNDAPMNLDDAMSMPMPLLAGNRLPWESCGAYDDTSNSIAEVGNWLALSTTLKSASDDLINLN